MKEQVVDAFQGQNMKLTVGYQLPSESVSFPALVTDYRESISEVYYAFPSAASGRAPVGTSDGWTFADALDTMAADLEDIAATGVGLVLLLNASCYGGRAMSFSLQDEVRKSMELAGRIGGLKAVTTTSLFIARCVKRDFPGVPVRASVNMRIGSIAAMEHLAGAFDGYYLKRELNRSPKMIAELKAWCDAHGKTLHLLANSGCLHDCAFQTFHDNLVAHEAEAAQEPGPGVRYAAPCWEYLEAPERHWRVLANCWIRPEDLHHYEAWFDTAKLATRMHDHPRMVIAAYAQERFHGNILDLLEPGHGTLPGMPILANDRFPDDWHQRVTACQHRCQSCGYCAEVFQKIAIKADF
jgi:collagenase-like PrtC family protease